MIYFPNFMWDLLISNCILVPCLVLVYMQYPLRTNSAPPNIDEQQREQVCLFRGCVCLAVIYHLYVAYSLVMKMRAHQGIYQCIPTYRQCNNLQDFACHVQPEALTCLGNEVICHSVCFFAIPQVSLLWDSVCSVSSKVNDFYFHPTQGFQTHTF